MRGCRWCWATPRLGGRRRARRGSVDVLHVDLYDHEAAAPVLDDEAFYARLPRGCWPKAA